MERRQLAMETLGLNLCESKAMLESVQDFVVAQQVVEDLKQRRRCPECGDLYTNKGGGKIEVKTLFGVVEVANPRWNRCSCQQGGPKTFRPAAAWLRGTTSPELLFLETKWASLIPFAKVADLLREVLPSEADHETIRRHLQATAQRMEEELGEERQLNLFDGEQLEQEEQAPPDGPITVGIDGGYVRAAHKEGFFEVIAGRSVVGFRRAAEDEVPEAKCFGYVQTYDEKPRRRLWELMKSQGLQDNQQVVFMSDGGEDVRRAQTRSAGSAATMRYTSQTPHDKDSCARSEIDTFSGSKTRRRHDRFAAAFKIPQLIQDTARFTDKAEYLSSVPDSNTCHTDIRWTGPL
jgi:hypothetical protein